MCEKETAIRITFVLVSSSFELNPLKRKQF